jgi:hypothetical protein
MFSFLTRTVDPAEMGRWIFALAYQSETIPQLAESLFSQMSSLPIGLERFRTEYMHLRLFVADYAIDSVAIRDPKVRKVREAYMDWIDRMAEHQENPTGVLHDVRTRFQRYGQAANDADHNGPAFAVAVTFLEFCGDTNRAKCSSEVIAVTGHFAATLQAVAEVLKSRKIA